MILLTPTLVSQVIREEAKKARCSYDDVVFRSQKQKAIAARVSAIRRLLAETGCQKRELAKAWGCPEMTIYTAIRSKSPPPLLLRRPDRRTAALGSRRGAHEPDPRGAGPGDVQRHHGVAQAWGEG